MATFYDNSTDRSVFAFDFVILWSEIQTFRTTYIAGAPSFLRSNEINSTISVALFQLHLGLLGCTTVLYLPKMGNRWSKSTRCNFSDFFF